MIMENASVVQRFSTNLSSSIVKLLSNVLSVLLVFE